MSSGAYKLGRQSFYFWDANGAGANPIAPYQCVSLASAAEVATALATGTFPGGIGVGDIVVATPIAANLSTRRVVGVTDAAAFSGGSISVITKGLMEVMAGAAIAFDQASGLVFPTLAETRTQLQTPFTNNLDMLLPVDPRVTLTYQLDLISAPVLVPASGGANVAYYPLGYMLEGATAKYDIIRVELDPRVVWL